jgi:hypothetical protein
MDDKAMAAACRKLAVALREVVAVLEGNIPGQQSTNQRIECLKRFNVLPADGLNRQQASQAFKESGYEPRSFGGWVRRGYIANVDDRRYLTAKGKALLAELTA